MITVKELITNSSETKELIINPEYLVSFQEIILKENLFTNKDVEKGTSILLSTGEEVKVANQYQLLSENLAKEIRMIEVDKISTFPDSRHKMELVRISLNVSHVVSCAEPGLGTLDKKEKMTRITLSTGEKLWVTNEFESVSNRLLEHKTT